MTGYPALPLPPGCPWSTFAPPHIKYCEENVCAWVVAPANTWSNLGYLIIGIWLWRKLIKERAGFVTLFGPAIIGTGVASFLYHASYTFIFQALDYIGMYMFSSLLLALNLKRLEWVSRKAVIPAYLVFIIAGTLPFLITGGSAGRSLFAIQLISAIGLEILLYFKSRKTGVKVAYRLFWTTLGIFALAYTAWWIDTGNIWCIPSNHFIQGHAVWHVVNAFCFATMAAFYRQFKELA